MKTLGNILWHIPFLGFVTAIVVYLIGLFLTVLVITAPIGLGLMELGKFLFWPFGNTMISKKELNQQQNPLWKSYSIFIMVLYLPLGLILAILSIIQVVLLFFSLVGIPVALVVANSISTYFNPVNKKCVSSAIAVELKRRKAQEQIDNKN